MALRPLLAVLSGPSGVGKDTVLDGLRRSDLALHIPITATTRPPRAGERHAVNHFFVTDQEFDRLVRDDELLEWAQVYGNRYGVPRTQVRRALSAGKIVLARTDIQGAASIREKAPEALLIFLAPPSLESLEMRIRERGGLDETDIARRLAAAGSEMQNTERFDYVVVNYDGASDAAVNRVRAILAEEAGREERPAPRV